MFELICNDDNEWYSSGKNRFGNWGQSKLCPVGYKIVGIQTQIERDQGRYGDNTALNGVKVLCRDFENIPVPSKSFEKRYLYNIPLCLFCLSVLPHQFLNFLKKLLGGFGYILHRSSLHCNFKQDMVSGMHSFA